IASASLFKNAKTVWKASELEPLRNTIHEIPGPNFAAVKVVAEKLPLVLPPREGALLKARFRRALLGPEADSV
ncbi:MAG: aldehyde dehydrogenase, partial [Burkholderiales bacterium]